MAPSPNAAVGPVPPIKFTTNPYLYGGSRGKGLGSSIAQELSPVFMCEGTFKDCRRMRIAKEILGRDSVGFGERRWHGDELWDI